MSERKHTDLWNELVDEAGENEIDRASTVSVAQAEAELKAAGFDVAAERAKAGAFVDALGRETRRRQRPRARVVWLAAAASLAAVGGTLYATLQPEIVGRPPPPTPSGSATVPSATGLVAAAELRRVATAACDAKQWSVCLAKLDDARALDPAGDDVQAVKTLRDKALAASRDGG